MQKDTFSDFITCIETAAAACSRYSKDHEIVTTFAAKAAAMTADLLHEGGLTVVQSAAGVMCNETPVAAQSYHMRSFVNRLQRKKIEKIVFRQNMDSEECRAFIANLVSQNPVLSRSNVTVQSAEDNLSATARTSDAVIDENITKLSAIFLGISASRQIDMPGLKEIVTDFILTLNTEKDVIPLLRPYRSHSEHLVVRSANITLLTLFQAQAMGFPSEILHGAGIAAILHNVGMLFILPSGAGDRRKRDPEFYEMMKNHPLYGSLFLSRIADVPPLAPVVAFEHHMKFDGRGYPDTKRIGKKQHVASQMVAIADLYEALSMDSPYHKAAEPSVVSGFLRERSGRDFNPMLVQNFLSALRDISRII
jgi:HD-GYP domain-containing protein (c-di-GMP phosphodiesterase class II)